MLCFLIASCQVAHDVNWDLSRYWGLPDFSILKFRFFFLQLVSMLSAGILRLYTLLFIKLSSIRSFYWQMYLFISDDL